MREKLVLLPPPQMIRGRGGLAAPAGAQLTVEAEIDPGQAPAPAGSYRLEIAPSSEGGAVARMVAGDEAGLRHARATLGQLVARSDDGLPALEITDWPSFEVRGVMLDVSRDRVPTMQSLYTLVDQLASWKINHLELYTEHTFAYEGHEEIWRGCSPLTPREIRLLDRRCRERGIELAANQNCFGHLTRWLEAPRYAPLAETTGTWKFHGLPRTGPFSLCPIDHGSIELITDLLDQLVPCFSSRIVNIGCDETADVGHGRSREAVERRGRAAVYFDFLRQIDAIVRRHGRRSMFWADIALSHPDDVGEIPGDMVALAWGYEADSPFDDWLAALRGPPHGSASREIWVCPGTSSWRSITGRTSDRRANLERAAVSGVAGGARGYLVTDWGDLGHRQQWPISLIGLAEGASRAWNADVPPEPRAVSTIALGDSTGETERWLADLGDADLELRKVAGPPGRGGRTRQLANSSALFVDLETPLADSSIRGDEPLWRAARERLEGLAASVPASAATPQLRAELLHSARIALLAANRALLRFGGNAPLSRSRIATDLAELIDEHRELWLARSRPGGLESSCSYYQGVQEELQG